MLIGINASSGIAIGKAFVIKEQEIKISKFLVQDEKEELKRFNGAIDIGKKEIYELISNINDLNKSEKDIFEAHLMLLEDPEFIGVIVKKILEEKVNSEYAIKVVSDDLIEMFRDIDDEYIKERSLDICDVSKRLLGILKGDSDNLIKSINEECIIISKDITPSQTAQMNKKKVLGFATEIGGVTSHSSIIARTLGIPAVVGITNLINEVNTDDLIILDGSEGILIVNPDEESLNLYQEKMNQYGKEQKELVRYKSLDTVTQDFKKLVVAGNIGAVEEAENVLENGGEGIGLFRTEFLYMEKSQLPSEEEQFEAYKNVVEKFKDKPVIIRTLDIGGDKNLPYLPIDKELNPFLGYRAVRLCLDRKDIFKVQLRALLRASNYGRLKIMFPMICNLSELLECKKILNECKEELKAEGKVYNESLKVGIMIEVPSAAIISDVLAKEVDFFSIGTNDLIQYTLAVDRMNEKISYLYDFSHLAVLRLIKLIIENGKKAGISVGMCGEMAAKEELIPVLLGMGLDEFSVSSASILKVRKIIRSLKYSDCEKIAKEFLDNK